MSRTKIQIGDVFEIDTPKGKAYLHYIYKDPRVGELVRVLPSIYSERPANAGELASHPEIFMVFFPLSAAYRRDIVSKVGFFSADNYAKPKYMRDKHVVRGEFRGWHIVDTDTWHNQLVKDLSEEQKRLSPWGIWNDTLLIDKLIEGWSPEMWE